MPLMSHLSELRKRLFLTFFALVGGWVIGFFFANPLITYMKQMPPADVLEWNVFTPWDAIRIYMNVAFLIGVLLALPVAMYQLWAFVRPALTPLERKVSLVYIPFVLLLFVVGLVFGYFIVFRMAMQFTSSISQSLGLVETYGAAQYFSFMTNILIPLALLFELPLVVMFLTKLRLLRPHRLRKVRKPAFLMLVIVSTLITPPDAISAIIVALPMIVLYEFSVWLSSLVYRKQEIADEQLEQEEEARG